MKCSVCKVLDEARYSRMLKQGKSTDRNEIPEACASFEMSNGMTAYICSQHLTASIEALDSLLLGKERKYSM